MQKRKKNWTSYLPYSFLVIAMVAVAILLWLHFFPQAFVPHQNTTEVGTPYFSYKYIRHNIPARCFIDIDPMENYTVTTVLFTVRMQNGTVFTSQPGTKNPYDNSQWYSPNFTPVITDINAVSPGVDERGQINCSVYVIDSAYNRYSRNTSTYFGYSLQSSCNTSDGCLLSSGLAGARGYYYYDNITLPVGQTLSIINPGNYNKGRAYFYAKQIDFLGSITRQTASGDAPDLGIDAYNITLAAITLSGSNGAACALGYDGGNVYIANFFRLNLSGAIALNAGSGGTCATGGDAGGDGGTSGSLAIEGYSGTVYAGNTITINGGAGGAGDSDPGGSGNGGYGGWAYPCLSMSNVLFNHTAGAISCAAGAGGAGGSGGSGGAGGDGGSGNVYILSSAVHNANTMAFTGGAGGAGGTTAGNGGNGAAFEFSVCDSNGYACSLFLNSNTITITHGNGGNAAAGGTGGWAYCFNGNSCNQSIYFRGNVRLTSTITYTVPTCGSPTPVGCAPASNGGWRYYFNNGNNLTGNAFTNLAPVRTEMSSVNPIFPIPTTTTVSFGAGMIRYANMSINVTGDANVSTFNIFLKQPNGMWSNYYTTNQSLDMHRFVNGTYTVYEYGSSGVGLATTPQIATANVSYIPMNLTCSISPAPSLNLTSRYFNITCYVNSTVDNRSVYYAGVWSLINGSVFSLTQSNTNVPYKKTNSYYFPATAQFPVVAYFNKTDYAPMDYSLGNISMYPFLVELPYGINDVKSYCLFPTMYNVKPAGQTWYMGIFKFVNLWNTSVNISGTLNDTLPDHITQWLIGDSCTNVTFSSLALPVPGYILYGMEGYVDNDTVEYFNDTIANLTDVPNYRISSYSLGCGGSPVLNITRDWSGLWYANQIYPTGGDGLACRYTTNTFNFTQNSSFYVWAKGLFTLRIYNATAPSENYTIYKMDSGQSAIFNSNTSTQWVFCALNGNESIPDWTLYKVVLNTTSTSPRRIYFYSYSGQVYSDNCTAVSGSGAGISGAEYSSWFSNITFGPSWAKSKGDHGTGDYSIAFTGTNGTYLVTDNTTSVQQTPNMTIAMWLYPAEYDSFMTASAGPYLYAKPLPITTPFDTEYYAYLNKSYHLRIRFGYDNGTANTTFVFNTNEIISKFTWTHLTIVKKTSGTTMNVSYYINGIYKNSTTVSNYVSDYKNTHPLIIGGHNATVVGSFGFITQSYSGLMDEFVISPTALTANQIWNLYDSGIQPDGLVGYWRMNEGNGTIVADSTGHNDLTKGAAVNWSDVYKDGSALKFPGVSVSGCSAYLSGSNAINLTEPPNNMTISAWVYRTGNHGTGVGYIVVKRLGLSPFYSYYLRYNDPNSIAFAMRGVDNVSYIKTYTDASALPLDTWVHITAVYNGSDLRIYRNGIDVGTPATANVDIQYSDTGNSFDIGCFFHVTSGFNGTIDDVRLYNTSLTAAQVYSLYNSTTSYNYQPVLCGINAYDGTQNSSNFSKFVWLYTNCTNATVDGTSVTHYDSYIWNSTGG